MTAPHVAPQVRNPELVSDNTLHVIGVVSNSARWHSRLRLTREWLERMEATKCVVPYLVEAAFGDRAHEVAISDNPRHLMLRTSSEAWVKESMINLGVRYLLPRHWKYVAWIDADVEFRRTDWAQETLHQLQHWAVVQPWQQCSDLGPHGNVLQIHTSFGSLAATGAKMQAKASDPYPFGHPGFAWAARRDLWEATGGLMDHCILGSGDHHMAHAMVGRVEPSIHGSCTESYARRCQDWARRATRVTGGQVGFAVGRIEHHFHGPKKNRFYQERWQILVDNHFDPDTDLTHDEQGLIQLVGKPRLEAALRAYNRSRAEDSIEE
jgi:hypothetical protein